MRGGVLDGAATERRRGGWVIGPSEPMNCLVVAAACSVTVSVGVIATAAADQSRLGAPTFWPWVLTALQVLALWVAGRSLWWGWPLGASVQIPWIAYAVVTNQIGFIPGCIASALVQAHSFLQSFRDPHSVIPEVVRRRSIRFRRVEPAV